MRCDECPKAEPIGSGRYRCPYEPGEVCEPYDGCTRLESVRADKPEPTCPKCGASREAVVLLTPAEGFWRPVEEGRPFEFRRESPWDLPFDEADLRCEHCGYQWPVASEKLVLQDCGADSTVSFGNCRGGATTRDCAASGLTPVHWESRAFRETVAAAVRGDEDLTYQCGGCSAIGKTTNFELPEGWFKSEDGRFYCAKCRTLPYWEHPNVKRQMEADEQEFKVGQGVRVRAGNAYAGELGTVTQIHWDRQTLVYGVHFGGRGCCYSASELEACADIGAFNALEEPEFKAGDLVRAPHALLQGLPLTGRATSAKPERSDMVMITTDGDDRYGVVARDVEHWPLERLDRVRVVDLSEDRFNHVGCVTDVGQFGAWVDFSRYDEGDDEEEWFEFNQLDNVSAFDEGDEEDES